MAELTQADLTLAPQVRRIAEHGTVEEKRVLLRAFVREIEFDPASRMGAAYLHAVPTLNDDGEPVRAGETRCVCRGLMILLEAVERL